MDTSSLFCDTSFFFASLTVSDPNHPAAREALLAHPKSNLITTWDIISETVTLLRYRESYRLALQFLDQVRPHLEVISFDNSLREEAALVFKKFSKDKKLSFCDCISFVILTILLPEIPVLTFDGDFKQFGFPLGC